MRGVLVSIVFCFALMMVGCGASRQSGVCGTMDFPKVEGDAQALIAQGEPLTYDLVGEERAAPMSIVTSAIIDGLRDRLGR